MGKQYEEEEDPGHWYDCQIGPGLINSAHYIDEDDCIYKGKYGNRVGMGRIETVHRRTLTLIYQLPPEPQTGYAHYRNSDGHHCEPNHKKIPNRTGLHAVHGDRMDSPSFTYRLKV